MARSSANAPVTIAPTELRSSDAVSPMVKPERPTAAFCSAAITRGLKRAGAGAACLESGAIIARMRVPSTAFTHL
eukprot:scaffold9973_cov125-Isochrysis_galbana.AAC.8